MRHPGVQFAQDLRSGHPYVIEEDLVELGPAGDLLQGLDGDARAVHIHHQIADATVLRGLRVGAHQKNAHIGVLGHAGPDFLAIDHKIVAVLHRARLQGSEVGAGIGFGEALAPDFLATENFGDVALLLRFRTVRHEGRTDDHQPQQVGHFRSLGASHLFREYCLLDQRGSPPAVFLGPVDARPAGIVHLALPSAAILERRVRILRHWLPRHISLQPAANGLLKRDRTVVKTNVHVELALLHG